MRLIYADKCPCITCTDERNAHCTYEHRSCDKFCKWLNTTAYDKEKVVEQLKNMYIPIVEDLGDTSYELVRKRKAIDIVKAGGVNE